jgi:hypothetical protein
MKPGGLRERAELRVRARALGWIAAPIPAAVVGFTLVATMGSGSLEDGFAALGLSAWGPVITITASSALVLPLFFRYLRRTGNPASSIGFGIYRWRDVALGAAASTSGGGASIRPSLSISPTISLPSTFSGHR